MQTTTDFISKVVTPSKRAIVADYPVMDTLLWVARKRGFADEAVLYWLAVRIARMKNIPCKDWEHCRNNSMFLDNAFRQYEDIVHAVTYPIELQSIEAIYLLADNSVVIVEPVQPEK